MTPDIDLTENEQAALDEQAAEVAAANEPAAPVVAADATPEVTPAAPDPVLSAIADNAAATRALAEQLAADRAAADAAKAAAAQPEVPVAAPRDFDAEFTALQQQYDDGDLDAAEHAKALRQLTLDEADARATAAIARDREAQAKAAADAAAKAQAESEAKSEADWNAANAEFFKDPGNAALVGDEIKKAAFQAAINVVGREHPGIAFNDLLVKARERITGVPAIDTAKAVKDATFERQQQAGAAAPNTLRNVPSAGHPAGADPGAALDNLDINTLEDTLARMSDADRNRYLAGAPGNEQRSAA